MPQPEDFVKIKKKKPVTFATGPAPWEGIVGGGLVAPGLPAGQHHVEQQWTWNPANQTWTENPDFHTTIPAPQPPVATWQDFNPIAPQHFATFAPEGALAGETPVAPEPAVNGLNEALMAQSLDEMTKQYMKKVAKQDTSIKKPAKKLWWQKIDEYPKGQHEKTPVAERVCVVSGKPEEKTMATNWSWHPPYWINVNHIDPFYSYFRYCEKTFEWVEAGKMGRIYNGNHVSIEWLKKNGYVVLEDRFESYWEKPVNCFEYFTSDDDGKRPRLAPTSALKNFPICPIIKKRVYSGELHAVTTVEGMVKVSSLGVKNDTTIKQCVQCHELFQGPIIVMFQPTTEYPTAPWCVKCKSKVIEKSVIRHFDDSNFLPAMHDVVTCKLHGKPVEQKKVRLFGVELEVGFNANKERAEVALDVWDVLGRDFCYIKHDGSIMKKQFDDGYIVKNPMKSGFEIVSAPAGINVHRERWKALANVRDFKILRAWDADSCGLHVHVNRKSLTWLQIGRMLVFMNHPNNRYFVEVVAGRNSNFYTRYIKKEFTDCGVVDESKYMALRTNKADTIEFRIFRSTINYRHIMRDIEFAEAVCDFCAPCANSLKDILDFRCFIKFVAGHKERFPMLAEWLQSIELIAKKPLPNPKFAKPLDLEEALSDAVKDQLAGVYKMIATKEPIKHSIPEEQAVVQQAEEPLDDDDEA